MSWIQRNLNADITHWVVTHGAFGITFGTPTTQKGFWNDRNEIFKTPQGEDAVSRSIVYLTSDVAEGDYLFEGVSTDTNPTLLDGARRIEKFEKLPDLRNLDHQRKAYL